MNIKDREGRKEMDDGQKLAVSSTMEEDGLSPGVSSCPVRGHESVLNIVDDVGLLESAS